MLFYYFFNFSHPYSPFWYSINENVDQILVIEDGRISQIGTHIELLKQPGIYRNFIEIRERTEGHIV